MHLEIDMKLRNKHENAEKYEIIKGKNFFLEDLGVSSWIFVFNNIKVLIILS